MMSNLINRLCASLSVFFIFNGVGLAMEKDNSVMYIAEMRSEKIYCTFFVNDVPVLTTQGYEIDQQFTFTDNISRSLGEGKNTFSIHVMDVPETKNDAFCEMTVTAFVNDTKNNEVKNQEISSILVTYDKEGQFTISKSKDYGDSPLTKNVTLSLSDKAAYSNQADGLINDGIATRDLWINHPYKHHSWSYKSTPIKNTPEYFDKVWKKHEEFRQAMAERDRNKIKQLLNPGIMETERLQGDMETLVWTNAILDSFEESWSADDFQLLPVSPEDYELIIGAEGRLFRLNYKGSYLPRLSPLRYNANGKNGRFNFDFTLIDGEVVMAF